jgi:5-methylcytosine-specific restriction endonuclease McrA
MRETLEVNTPQLALGERGTSIAPHVCNNSSNKCAWRAGYTTARSAEYPQKVSTIKFDHAEVPNCGELDYGEVIHVRASIAGMSLLVAQWGGGPSLTAFWTQMESARG